jgi:hypothetical protein
MPVGPGQALKTAALRDCEPPYDRSGVKTGKARNEHIFSGLPSGRDIHPRRWQVSSVPILLQKLPMRDASCAGVEPEPWPTSRSVEATALTPSTRLQRD